uniref:Uncharacterized protein n=1 Tax=Cucumis melo TaxID=3656 RepID=A0A9I9CUK0_CUCME
RIVKEPPTKQSVCCEAVYRQLFDSSPQLSATPRVTFDRGGGKRTTNLVIHELFKEFGTHVTHGDNSPPRFTSPIQTHDSPPPTLVHPKTGCNAGPSTMPPSMLEQLVQDSSISPIEPVRLVFVSRPRSNVW